MSHPLRGSLLAGVAWGTVMFLCWCGVTGFQDVVFILEVMVGGAVLFTGFCFLAVLRVRWKARDADGKNPAAG